jgi:ribosomal protein S18 acetylase RimI-like enzyme
VIRYRAFRNGDPPALADLWNRATPEVGVVRPLTPHEFDEMVVGKLHFDAQGLILAEEENKLVGFIHAGFGPESLTDLPQRLDRAMGTVAMLVVDPGRDDSALEQGLMAEAENYLRSGGAKVIYAGGQTDLSSFYWGVYGGSEYSGILENHKTFVRAAHDRGYAPVAISVLLEADLTAPEIRDPKSAVIRRQTRVEIVDDARPANWWEASAIGYTQITHYHVHARDDDRLLARATAWDMAAFGRQDGKSRTGVIDVEVTEGERRKGYGRFLIGEILRHSRSQWAEAVAIQTRTTNLAALNLYKSAGFEPVGQATLYRKPGPR